MNETVPSFVLKQNTIPLLKRVIKTYVWGYKKSVIIAMSCMVIVALMTAANAWMMQPVLDNIFLKKDASMLILIPIAVIGIAVVNAIASYFQTTIMRELGQKVIARMQKDLFRHLMHSDLSLFHDQASGRLISRFTTDIMLMRNALSNALTGLIRDSLATVFLVAVMFYQSWQLALIAFTVFPLMVYPVIRLGKRMRKLSDSTQDELGTLANRLDETFTGVRVVKAYGREDFEITRASGIIDSLYHLYVRASRVQAASAPILELLTGCAIAAVIYYGGLGVVKETTSPGAFFSFITAMIMAYKPARNMTSMNGYVQEGLAAAARLFSVLDTKPEVEDSPNAKPLTLTEGSITFSHVHFRYNKSGGGVEDISFKVPHGKTVALVGLSGSGKSTLMNLLLRFYDVQAGRILIDGQDIQEITLASLRQNIALVSQDIVLFDDTVRTNIAYGKLDATDDEITAAAIDAAADEFIRDMPKGYDTMIGPNGVKLSGGQRQRIAIARAMLKNAPILLLDEATSSLDTESERSVQRALEALAKGRTTLVVAHRLSTIINADVIYVLEQGRIVESGNHMELLKKGGRYHQLYSGQYDHGEIAFV
jgi:subfamily B ATP-binding cassette protein MsbA